MESICTWMLFWASAIHDALSKSYILVEDIFMRSPHLVPSSRIILTAGGIQHELALA